ncbi:hypothetical protein [Hymenobacter bucti]|uniref:Uncharacterized protein n=1 Tax=Hymenobacter bucti TaxID=1844114 RepID=A0ABW4R266_9BACT
MPPPTYPHAPLPADANAEDQAMQPVLEQLLLEMLANRGGKLTTFPTYVAARAQDAAYQGRLLLATAAVMNANMGDQATYNNAAHWSLREVFNSLLRGTVALSEAHWLRLLERCRQPRQPDTRAKYPASSFFSLSLLLNQLARHAKKQPVQHLPLRALLAHLLTESSTASKEDAKVQAKIREILGPDTPASPF